MGQFQQILQYDDRVDPVAIHRAELFERRGDFSGNDRVKQVEHRTPVGETQHVAHLLRGYRTARQRDCLVEQRQPVANRSVGGTGDNLDRFLLNLYRFLGRHRPEMVGQLVLVDAAQVEALTARQDRNRHLANLGRREDEDNVVGRLLQRLQQTVEGLPGEHVDLVDDVDLVTRRNRFVANPFDQFADIVDAGTAGRIHFDHIDMPVLGDRGAMLANAAGINRRSAVAIRPDTIEGACDDPRCRGLADAAHAGQYKGVGDAASFDGVGKSPD